MEVWYDNALVCANGHVLNEEAEAIPEKNSPFCPLCGEGTLTRCPECNTPIRGRCHEPGVSYPRMMRPPAFCHDCGEPYPWTHDRLDAARQLAAEIKELSSEEREMLSQYLPDLIADNPRTELAALRTRRLLEKAAKEGGQALRKVIIDLATESARKLILPQ